MTVDLFHTLFKQGKPVIACIHLKALLGSPLYEGKMHAIYDQALADCEIYEKAGVDGLIIENFHDRPFYPNNLPAQTIASMAGIGREIRRQTYLPIGINALRNDACAAMSIATAIEAEFIRVNIHMHACVSDQGIIVGKAFDTLRLKKNLGSQVQIWADVKVKHATPLGNIDLVQEVEDLCERGLVDALIVSGRATGKSIDLSDLHTVASATHSPILIGSGMSPENVETIYPHASGFIVGSYFKKDGKAENEVDEKRVVKMVESVRGML